MSAGLSSVNGSERNCSFLVPWVGLCHYVHSPQLNVAQCGRGRGIYPLGIKPKACGFQWLLTLTSAIYTAATPISLLSLRMQLALSACVVVCKGTVKWTVDVD